MTVLILIPLLILGFGLLILGLRGKRIGDHPVCRRCGFDLFGLPREQERCPECGQVLLSGGVHIGHKKRKPVLISIGLAMLLLGIGGVVLILAQLDLTPYKPVWWLKREALVMLTRNAAVDELNRRLKNALLTPSEIDDIADEALAEQADMKKTWLPAWGDFIETARLTTQLDEARWKKYALQALQPPKLLLRQKIRRGDPLVVGTQSMPARVGKNSTPPLSAQSATSRIDGDTIGVKDHLGSGGGSLSISGGGMSWQSVDCDAAKLKTAKDGMHTIHMSLVEEVKPDWSSKEVLATKHFDLQADFQLVPADAETVKQIKDDSLKPKIQSSLKVRDFKAESYRENYYSIMVDANNPPVGVAFSIFVKTSEKTWPLGGVHFIASNNGGYSTGGEIQNFTVAKADIILKSDLNVAINSMNLTEMWVGEIVFKDVPVIRPTTQPVIKR